MPADGRRVVAHGLDPEFEPAVICLCAADSVIVFSSNIDSELPAIASRRHVCGNTDLAAASLKTPEVALAFAFPRSRLFALTKFINILIPSIALTALLARRMGNHRIGRFLAPTLASLVCDGSLFAANSLVNNQRAVYWLIPKAVLSVAIVAALVVFREVSPL